MSEAPAVVFREPRKAALGQRSSRFTVATYCLVAVGLTTTLGWIVIHQPVAALLTAAVLWGWSEVDGLCGKAHFCTLTPLRALDPTGKVWRRAAAGYLLGGIATSTLVGSLVGAGGFIFRQHLREGLLVVAAAALVLMARELRIFWFHLPQFWRQTHKQWAFQYGMVQAAAMWGAHIGVGFATVIKHGGFFILVGFALLLGPLLGALLMSMYWFGRALPVVLAPLLTSDCDDGDKLVQLLSGAGAACRYVCATGLLCAAAVALILAGITVT